MARLLTSGFEAPSSPTEEGWEAYAGTALTEASSWVFSNRDIDDALTFSQVKTNRRRIGGQRACRCYDSNDSLTQAFKRNLSPPVTEAWVRFAMQSQGGRVNNQRIMEFHLNGIGTICSLVEDDTSGVFSGVRLLNNAGLELQVNENGLFGAESYRWDTFEVHVLLAGSGGLFEVWINGNKVLQYTGPLTGPGGEITFDAIIIGGGNPSAGQAFNTNSRRDYDDIALNDTTGTSNNGRIGNGVIFRRMPRFPGSTTQMLSDVGPADADNNYRRVNRVADPNGFVGTLTPGDKDTYALANARRGHNIDGYGMPVKRGHYPAIVLQARATQNGPSINNIRYSVTPPAQAEILSPAAPGLALSTGGLVTVNHQVEVNPNTGEPFTHADLDGAEAGFSLEA